MSCRKHLNAGFTLVEMAVVLVIMGLIIGATVSFTAAQMDNAKMSATKTKQEAIRLALQSFVQRNGRLPCPAPAASTTGAEATTPGTCAGSTVINGVTAAERNRRGIVPWAALGLTESAINDGYGRRFTYQVTQSATGTSFLNVNLITGTISVYGDTPVAATNQINSGNRAVYMLVSYGKNGLGAYLSGGGTMTPPPITNASEVENTDTDLDFVSAAYSEATPVFDDYLSWASASDILTPLTNDGSIKSAQAVQQEAFYQLKLSLVQHAFILGSGTGTYTLADPVDPPGTTTPNYTYSTPITGCGTITTKRFPTNLPGVLYSGGRINDVWGTELIYMLGSNAKSYIGGTAPTCKYATAFISAGPDKTPNNSDDIIYPVTPNDYFANFVRLGGF